jgi:predicted transglutaminase-like cysteine proteinase
MTWSCRVQGSAAVGWRLGLIIVLVLAISPQTAGAASVGGSRPLFGTLEAQSDNITLFPKWTGMLARHATEKPLMEEPCGDRPRRPCELRNWSAFLDSVRPQSRRAQLDAVNRHMNRKRYVIDPTNYGVPDYWATPIQFLHLNGDCEDYAIAKYLSLRDLGFDGDDLRIVVLDDLNLGIAHAVLAVYLDNDIFILDNQIDAVVSADVIRHYRPIYSVNERHWWLHRP